MRLLLEYMYLGSISVAQSDLAEILRTASSLKIRGLTTAEPPTEDLEDTPLIVDEHFPAAVDTFQHVETSSSHSAASGKSGLSRRNPHDGGRKSSVPKKLRLSDDRESDVSSPRAAWPAAPEDQLHRGTSPLEGRTSSSDNHSPVHHNLAVSDTEQSDLVEESDQPVDFSATGAKISVAPQFSIL